MKRAALALAVAACGTPTPQIKLHLARTLSQQCMANCADIPLPCNAVMSIRIVDHDDPSIRYLEQCAPVTPDNNYDVCSLNHIVLEQDAIPVHELAVQIAVFPGEALGFTGEGDPVCPDVNFNHANGLPVEEVGAPALGGETFYHPGDSEVDVTLGCTDLSAMRAGKTCKNPTADALSATVVDFDTRAPVRAGQQGDAERLVVLVGEPHLFDGGYVLNASDTISLKLDAEDTSSPVWTAAAEPAFVDNACVEVLEVGPQGSTASLHCAPVGDPPPELRGIWIKRDRLRSIVGSLGLSEFPDEGLTVGMVVDGTANGVANYTVKPSGAGSVVYVSDDGLVGGSATSKTGIFVSRDAPFGTMFSATGMKPTVPAVGGLVAGKVTIVIVPFAPAQ